LISAIIVESLVASLIFNTFTFHLFIYILHQIHYIQWCCHLWMLNPFWTWAAVFVEIELKKHVWVRL